MGRPKICGIYKITSPSGKVYIGESVDINKRFKNYNNLRCKSQTILYRSFLKYTPENHIFEIIEECLEESLKCRERYWQDFYDVINPAKGLNCKLTSCGDKKLVHSEETRKKISDANKGQVGKSGKENPMYGLYGESNPNFGSKRTEEQRKNISESLLGKASGCNNPRAVKVIDVDTKIVYCSIDEAISAFKISRTHFYRYMNGVLPNKTPLMFLKEYIKLYPDFKI